MDFLRAASALISVFGLLGLLYFVSNRARNRATLPARIVRCIWPQRLRVCGARTEPAPLKVLRRVNLNATHQLHLIRAIGETFLICTHPHGCALLRGADVAGQEGNAAESLQRHAG